MTQYYEVVEQQRLMLEAEEWSKGVKDIHCFNTETCTVWYEKRPDDGRVMDIRFNDGRIRRELLPSGKIVYFGSRLKGNQLLDAYCRHNAGRSDRG